MKKMIKEYIEKDVKLEKERKIGVILLVITFAGIFGWIYEVLFYYMNSGFKEIYFRGGNFLPWINIYAIGSVLVLFLTYKLRKNPLKVFLISALSTGVLEYISGYILYGVLGMVKCWDYNTEILNFGNISGYVCLRSVLVFGLSSLMLMYLIVPLFIKLALKMDKKKFLVMSIIISLPFLIDEIYNLVFTRLFGLPSASSIYKKLGVKYLYFS